MQPISKIKTTCFKKRLQTLDYIKNEKLKNVANKSLYLFAITIPILTLLLLFKLSL